MEKKYYVASDGNDKNEGSYEKPWKNIHQAVEKLTAGDQLIIRGGHYYIYEPVIFFNSGTRENRIIISGFENEEVVLDAMKMKGERGHPGVLQIENVENIIIKDIKIKNSKGQGIKIVDASYIEIKNCITENTFSCGIAMWDTDHDAQHCHHNKILYNTVIKANTWDMIPEGRVKKGEPPHEAISIGGGTDFEVAYNHVYNCDKEGIDVKEVSKNGEVHHNYIHDLQRQGLYADSWFGELRGIKFYKNVVKNCHGAGIAISVEGGSLLEDVSFFRNLIYNNDGTGILFARWGDDGFRKNVKIYNNTVVHNGYGKPAAGEKYFWITGGLYLFSANLEEIEIFNNIFCDNNNFEIGYSDLYLQDSDDVEAVFANKNIEIENNLINDNNNLDFPIYNGWENNYAYIYRYQNSKNKKGKPEFIAPEKENFHLSENSPAVGTALYKEGDYPGIMEDIGAFSVDEKKGLWWNN